MDRDLGSIRKRHWIWIPNWLSLFGAVMFVSSVLSALLFFVAEPRTHGTNAYAMLLVLGLLPGLAGAGLSMFVVGQWFDHRRRRVMGDDYIPQLNLATPGGYWAAVPIWIFGLVYLLLSLYWSYQSYHFVESTAFCGQLCHKAMTPEFVAHGLSPHAGVSCTACHVGPKPERFVKAKLSGIRQAYMYVTDTYSRPIPTPIHGLPPPGEACHQCHWPEDFVGSKLKEFIYYLPDEENTKYYTSMLVHVGGPPPEVGGETGLAGVAPGIHWHMYPNIKVEFIAVDEQKQSIPWVRVTNAKGNVTVYRHEDEERTDAELLAEYPVQTMDCHDCHNRAAHRFTTPQRMLNSSLIRDAIDPEIPWIKLRGLKLLAEEYSSKDEARQRIQDDLRSFYQTEHPEIWERLSERIIEAGDVIARSYELNVFPSMKTDWRASPDNIGHMVSMGCFRCHGGNHYAEDDSEIRKECDICHEFVRQGTGPDLPVLAGNQEYSHYGKAGKLWKMSKCTDCHEGVGALSE